MGPGGRLGIEAGPTTENLVQESRQLEAPGTDPMGGSRALNEAERAWINGGLSVILEGGADVNHARAEGFFGGASLNDGDVILGQKGIGLGHVLIIGATVGFPAED